MFVEEYSRYTLLSRGGSSSWNLDKRTVILLSVIILPVFIFCITYMILFGFYEKIVYPKSASVEEISRQSLHRAVVYNSFSETNNVNPDFHSTIRGSGENLNTYNLICYYNFPSISNSLQVEDLDPFLCTHINVAFARVRNNSISLSAENQNELRKLVKLKQFNNDLKVVVSVGGAGGDRGFPEMVSNHTNRKRFIQSVLDYVVNYGIDGIDLDWEFPNEKQGLDQYQRMHFTQLLAELRKCVDRQPKYSFLISVAVAATVNLIDNSYDVSYMNQYVDYINLMAYDYHYYTKFTPFTGFNSPLYTVESEKFYLATLNINYSANYWHYLGMDKSKIMVGLPTYGHSFTLVNIRNNGLYAPASGYGKLGSQGFVDYTQVCTFLSANHISPVFDMDTKSPYAVKYFEWVSFDDAESLTYKAEYIRDNKFGGAMVYSLNGDDYKGVCKLQGRSTGKFTLVNIIKQILSDV